MSLVDIAIEEEIPPASIVLFGVLNWGLGHASRSIPVIRALLARGHDVHVAGDGLSLQWLKNEIEGVVWHELPVNDFPFPGNGFLQNLKALLPALVKNIIWDRIHVKKIMKSLKADIIISDNRFVFRHRTALKNIYITHQYRLFHKNFLISRLLSAIHQFFISRFDACWIPDMPENGLAGILSDETTKNNIRYIGLLTRIRLQREKPKNIDFLFLVSGPEPQRSVFENEILKLEKELSSKKVCLIRGSQKRRPALMSGLSWDIHDLAATTMLEEKLSGCRALVCRPGYSTLMDIDGLTVPVLLVPTPGQTEQEYLAERAPVLYANAESVSQSGFREYFLTGFSGEK